MPPSLSHKANCFCWYVEVDTFSSPQGHGKTTSEVLVTPKAVKADSGKSKSDQDKQGKVKKEPRPDRERSSTPDDKTNGKPEKESTYLDPWSQAIATFGMPKIPKKKTKVSLIFSSLQPP